MGNTAKAAFSSLSPAHKLYSGMKDGNRAQRKQKKAAKLIADAGARQKLLVDQRSARTDDAARGQRKAGARRRRGLLAYTGNLNTSLGGS